MNDIQAERMVTTPTGASPRLNQVSAALLILRIAVAVPFIYHGSGILFGAFDGPGVTKFAGNHMPMPIAFLVGLAEFAGGLAVLTGVLARLGAACIAIVMLGAIFLVHLPKGFDITKGGYEYALTQLLICVVLLIIGAGAYSLAALLPKKKN